MSVSISLCSISAIRIRYSSPRSLDSHSRLIYFILAACSRDIFSEMSWYLPCRSLNYRFASRSRSSWVLICNSWSRCCWEWSFATLSSSNFKFRLSMTISLHLFSRSVSYLASAFSLRISSSSSLSILTFISAVSRRFCSKIFSMCLSMFSLPTSST
jgi:hypothetical protein